MDKRSAKRWACFRAALVLQDALDAGWPFNGHTDLTHEDGELNADGLRVSSVLTELVDELSRRGSEHED